MRILGIETSCDDTAIAVYDSEFGIIFNQVYNQADLNDTYGGIVPELAARKHSETLVVLLKNLFFIGKISKDSIDAVAYTSGPGLAGSLLIGASVGTALAFSLNIPVVLVNHMEAHLLTPMLSKRQPKFPFVTLLVSGGHTQLINALGIGNYKLLGSTRDDAAGEAFDKIAQLLGLKYPGGANLSKLARLGISGKFNFPRPMISCSGLDFSFSGLKTYVTNIIKKNNDDFQTKADIAKEFESAVVDSLVFKCIRAMKKLNYNTLVVSGGVSKNKILRKSLNKIINKYSYKVFYPMSEYCTDNAAMVAYVGYVRFDKFKSFNVNIKINPSWSIEDLKKI